MMGGGRTLGREAMITMAPDVPPWVRSTLDETLVEAGAAAGAEARGKAVDSLLIAWSLDGRTHHNTRHLSSLLGRLEELEDAASDPALLRLAAAYRGATEEMGWEELLDGPLPAAVPALVDPNTLLSLGVPPENVERIDDLVCQLRNHDPRQDDLDAQILVDADLSILASSPQQYRGYLKGLREQAQHLSDEDFFEARLRLIDTLLEKPRIFTSPLARTLEERARENLEGERLSLGAVEPAESRSKPKAPSGTVRAKKKSGRQPLVIRASRAQKAKQLRMEEDRKVSEGREPESGKHLSRKSDSPWRSEGDPDFGSLQVDDTSTLESVADLIEGRRHRRH